MVEVCFAKQTFLSLFIRGYPCSSVSSLAAPKPLQQRQEEHGWTRTREGDGHGWSGFASRCKRSYPSSSVDIRVIPVKPCGTEAASTVQRGTRMDTDKRRG